MEEKKWKDYNVNLNEMFKEHLDEIKNKTYEYSDNELKAILNLIKYEIANNPFFNPKKYSKEDFQDFVMDAYLFYQERILPKLDPNVKNFMPVKFIRTGIDLFVKNNFNSMRHNRAQQKFEEKSVYNTLDIEIESDSTNGPFLNFVQSNLPKPSEAYYLDYVKEFELFVAKILKNKEFELLYQNLIDEIPCLQIAKKIDISHEKVRQNCREQADAIKLLCLEEGYPASLINAYFSNYRQYNKINDTHDFSSLIKKEGILSLIDHKTSDLESIKNDLNINKKGFSIALHFKLKDVEQKLIDKGYDQAKKIILFTMVCFPEYLKNIEKYDEYLRFANDYATKYKNGDKKSTANENITNTTFKSNFIFEKKQFKSRKEYFRSKWYNPFNNRINELKDVKDAYKYVTYIQLYMPDKLNTIDFRNKEFQNFVDRECENDAILKEFLVNRKKVAEISNELNTSVYTVHAHIFYAKSPTQRLNDFLTMQSLKDEDAYYPVSIIKGRPIEYADKFERDM